MTIQHLRSSTANKRPTPAAMSDGQIAVNTNTASPGLFFKDSAGALIKVGPVHVGTTAPNASPASGGETGNTVGEQWLDTTGGTYVFKVWDGSAWRSETGTFVDVNGDVMTGALGIIAGSAGSPGLYFSGDTNTGLYSPGSDQLALATGGSERLRITSAGLVGIGTSAPDRMLTVANTGGDSTVNILASATGESVLYFADSTSGAGSYVGYLQYIHSTDNLAIGCAAGDAIRIDASKRVGIGTTSPGAPLHVVAGTNARGIRISAVQNNSAAYLTFNDDLQNETAFIGNETRTGTAGQLVFGANGSERARIDSSGRLLVGTSSDSGGALLQVNGDRIRVGTAKTPASATATGTAGEICWDASYVYVCTATNTWKRSALSTW